MVFFLRSGGEGGGVRGNNNKLSACGLADTADTVRPTLIHALATVICL